MDEKRAFRKSSIRDVAKLASVSVTTVSHVVSGTKGYSQDTIERVKEAIQELNYVPSYAANALRKRATKTIGVCSRNPFRQTGKDLRSFSDRLWAGILEEADLNNYKVMHFPMSIQNSVDAGEFLNGQIDGLIMTANNLDERPAKLVRAGLPVVMVARTYDLPEGVDSVACDETAIMELGLNYLRGLGHTRIAHVAGPVEIIDDERGGAKYRDDVAVARLTAYEAWMKTHIQGFEPTSAVSGSWSGADLTDVVRRWIATTRPTAIFAANDDLARHVLEAAKSLGIAVPRQLSVIGIDNDDPSGFTEPPLTTIDIPIQEVGRQAVRTLLLRLRGESSSPQPFDVQVCEVTVRASAGPAPK